MADDLSGWTLQKADPDVSGWTLAPAHPPPAVDSGTGKAAATGLGALQGATAGFSDEIGGAGGAAVLGGRKLLDALTSKLGLSEHNRVLDRFPDNPVELYRDLRDSARKTNAAAKDAHPGYYMGGELGGTVASSLLLPGSGAARGAGLLSALGRGAATGAVAGLGASNADLTQGDVGRAALDTAAGAGVGLAAGGAGRALGALGQKAIGRVAAIDESVARKAADEAASLTASARGEAGRAAQDAYKQLEHLRELGAMGTLTQEQAKVAEQLQQELAGKASAKLLPAAAQKAAAAQAYSDAMSSEAQRAEELAAKKFSLGELKQQLGARLLRYGLPALGGAAAGLTGYGGHGALGGAAVGALAGAGMRPMLRSLIRMGSQPVVQRPVISGAAALLGAAAPLASGSAAPASLAASPQVAAMIAALRQSPQQSQAQPNTEGWELQ